MPGLVLKSTPMQDVGLLRLLLSPHQKTFTPEQWQNVEVKVADNGPATPSTEVAATPQA